MVPEPKVNAPGLAAVLADRLAKFEAPLAGVEDAPKENVGEAPDGEGLLIAELPNENDGVEDVALVADKPKPPKAGWLLSVDVVEMPLPNEKVGAVKAALGVEDVEDVEAEALLPNDGVEGVAGWAAGWLPLLTGLPPNVKPVLGSLS